MTLPYSPSRAVYQGNGVATAFPFAFKVWSTDHLSVSLTSPEGRTAAAQGWTASLGENGGTLTYLHNGNPLPDGWRLAIVRDMPFAQGIDLVSASRFDPQVIEDGLDQATAELQQLSEKITRAVIMPATSEQSPEDVVLSIFASRDAAAVSASAASAQATEAQTSALAAASSAATAAQSVQTASAGAVADATAQANAAAASATAAAQSAAEAEAASGGLAGRMDAVELKNTQQNTRLDGVEIGVAAISATLIGSVQAVMAAEEYVPNGCVPANGGEYTQAQFPSLYDTYLAGGKLLTCTYAAWTAQVALTGNCARFALDTTAQKFKVPLVKDGDSITQAASAAELGKSYKAGLPNIKGKAGGVVSNPLATDTNTGPFKTVANTTESLGGWTGSAYHHLEIDANQSSAIYQDGITTVLTEQVRLRHFVVVASAQNSASVFDWSNYMAALAGKANADLSNVTGNALGIYLYARDEKASAVTGGTYTSGTWATRDLNTMVKNFIPGASLSGNRITLPAGRYKIDATVPSSNVNICRAALYNATSSAYLLYSHTARSAYDYNGYTHMRIRGEFTLAAASSIELRMWGQTTHANGMGAASGSGVPEIYTEVEVWKM